MALAKKNHLNWIKHTIIIIIITSNNKTLPIHAAKEGENTKYNLHNFTHSIFLLYLPNDELQYFSVLNRVNFPPTS